MLDVIAFIFAIVLWFVMTVYLIVEHYDFKNRIKLLESENKILEEKFYSLFSCFCGSVNKEDNQ